MLRMAIAVDCGLNDRGRQGDEKREADTHNGAWNVRDLRLSSGVDRIDSWGIFSFSRLFRPEHGGTRFERDVSDPALKHDGDNC